jgi:2-polyprenyl-3-methyl-5-hydroxy-6-metoxy-1,4-benzoquinol methylase
LRNEYKEEFFQRYVSTHIVYRKGCPTIAEFRKRSILYDKQLGKFIPTDKTSKVLDIGCGSGALVWWLQHKGFENVTGVDASEEQISTGKCLGVPNLVNDNAFSFLKESAGGVDLVVARDVIEHFPKNEALELCRLTARVLRPRGRFLVQVPNAESPFFGRIRYGDLTHEAAYCARSLNQLLRVAGFVDVRCFPVRPAGIGHKAFMRSIVWRLIEAAMRLCLFSEIGSDATSSIVTQNIIAIGQSGLDE